MRVNILGSLEVEVGGLPAEIGGHRLRALLTRLALDPGRVVSTEALATAVWGDEPPADQANALQSLVSRLRRVLPEDVLRSASGGYRLEVEPEAVDAVRFEKAARQGREALRRGDAGEAADTLRAALKLWRGEAPAIRLEELRLTALEDRIAADLQVNPTAELVAEAAELEQRHPLRERPSGLLMKALAGQGRQAEALAVYERLRRRLADDLGADPSPDLQAAHVAILRGETRPKPRVPGNLKAALTSFVGREDELDRIGKQLIDSRLVTLVGPGGAGKTRLAATAGARYADRAPDGVWLAELAPITEPDDVAPAVLRSLDRRETSLTEARNRRRDVRERLVDLLAEDEALLILDNCEHVVEAAAELADDLLSRCPRLRILATTREPLGILGEALCPVTPLRPPPTGISAADALTYPAVQLLRDRASAVLPGFAVAPDNVDAIVEICRRLDGLPLGIELAAARLRTMPADQLAARLDDRFRLLTGGSRTAMPRHRTLRAVVAWSWDLLSTEERRLAELLAVFPATITADSAAGVAGLPEPPGVRSIQDLLDALVDKSILQLDAMDTPTQAVGPGHVAGARYRMLETIREYALDRLADTGSAEPARAAHAAYFLALTERAEPHTRQAEQLWWIALLSAERHNILGALQYAIDRGDANTALRIGTAMSLVWAIHGTQADAAEWLGRALRTPPPHPPQELVICTAMYAVHSAFLASISQRPEIGVERLSELLDGLDPTAGHAYLALIEPMLALFTDDTETGLASIERNLAHPDPWVRAMLTSLRGHIEENDGDAEGMLRDLSDAAHRFRALGERWGLSTTLTALADAYTKRGDFDAAIAVLEESIRLTRELNPGDEARHQTIWLTSLRARRDPVGAREFLREFVAERPGKRQSRDVAFALLALGDLARYMGDDAEAEEYYERGWQRQIDAPMVGPQLRALLRGGQAHLALGRRDIDLARRRVDEAIGYALDGRDMPVTAHVAVAAAAVRVAQDDIVGAAEVLGASEQLRGLPDKSNPDAIRLITTVRDALGEDDFAAAYARGRALSREAALALVTPASYRQDQGYSTDLGPRSVQYP
jgi:predicted ATPase/DNA-binding SARP family transcriptional activator